MKTAWKAECRNGARQADSNEGKGEGKPLLIDV